MGEYPANFPGCFGNLTDAEGNPYGDSAREQLDRVLGKPKKEYPHNNRMPYEEFLQKYLIGHNGNTEYYPKSAERYPPYNDILALKKNNSAEYVLGEFLRILANRRDPKYTELVEQFSHGGSRGEEFYQGEVDRIRNIMRRAGQNEDAAEDVWDESRRGAWRRAGTLPTEFGLPNSGWPESIKNLPEYQMQVLDQIKQYITTPVLTGEPKGGLSGY
jgi:hypothetical protein